VIIGGLLLFMTVLPFTMLMVSSFMKFFGMFDLPQPWTLRNWEEAFSRGDILRSFWNSIRLATSAALVGMISFSMIAYITVRTPFYGRKLLDFLTWLPAVIPGLVLSLGFLQMFVGTPVFRPIYGTMSVLVIALAIGTMTLGTQVIKTALMRIGAELEEASAAAGASRLYTFRRVILPLIVPSVAVIGLEVFAVGVSVVGLVAFLGTGATQPMSIIQLILLENGAFEAAAVVGILIMTTTISAALLARYISLKVGIGRA
jgi:ABC-type Fe3+ transport system permease subunit